MDSMKQITRKELEDQLRELNAQYDRRHRASYRRGLAIGIVGPLLVSVLALVFFGKDGVPLVGVAVVGGVYWCANVWLLYVTYKRR